MRSKTGNSSVLMKSLANVYEGRDNFVGGDIQLVVHALDSIVNMSTASAANELPSTAKVCTSRESTCVFYSFGIVNYFWLKV